MSLEEKKRFSRHARPWWDVHRHRIAPEVAQQLHDLIQQGRLEIVAGRIQSVEEQDGALNVAYRRRGSSRVSEGRFAYMLNCTGPLGTISRTSDPMLRQMLADGLIKPDELGIALDVDDRSRVVGSDRAWAMGPHDQGPVLGNHRGTRYQGPGGRGRGRH